MTTHIVEALRLVISKLAHLLIGSTFLLSSQLSFSNENTAHRSIVKTKSPTGDFYIIKDYVDKYNNDTDFRLYQIISLRAKDQLLKKIKKENANLSDKTITLNGFKKSKCWWMENRYFCDFLAPVKGISFKSKKFSGNFKSYLKTLNLLDSISVIDFNNKRYVVSLSIEKSTNLRPIEKLNLMKATKLLAESGLIKFSKGENIIYDLSYVDKKITTSSKTKSTTIKALSEMIKLKSSGVVKNFSYMWYISNGLMFHYAYIEIPKD
jgi:hypothetical protein